MTELAVASTSKTTVSKSIMGAVKYIITCCIVSFITYQFTMYQNRPIPVVSLSSVGFAGGGDLVEMSENFIKSYRNSPWKSQPYAQFMPYEKLVNEVDSLEKKRAELERASKKLSSWLKDKGTAWRNLNSVSVDELDTYPLLYDDFLLTIMTDLVRSGDRFVSIPTDASILANSTISGVSSVFNFKTKVYSIYVKSAVVLIPSTEAIPDPHKPQIDTFCNSIQSGNGPNLVYFAQRIYDYLTAEQSTLTVMIAELKSIIVPKLSIKAKCLLANLGKTALIIKPNAKIELMRRNSIKIVDMTISSGDKSSARASENVRVKSFLPDIDDLNYVLIPPDSTVGFTLIAVNPLGKEADDIKTMYDIGEFRCKVTLTKTDGSEINSEQLQFGPTKREISIP